MGDVIRFQFRVDALRPIAGQIADLVGVCAKRCAVLLMPAGRILIIDCESGAEQIGELVREPGYTLAGVFEPGVSTDTVYEAIYALDWRP